MISFQELNSNPNKYNGQHINITGQIVQINEVNGQTNLILAVTPLSTGWSSSDLIYVTYKAQIQYKIGDIVTVYGTVSGTYNYISVSQGMQTLIKITARDIELTPLSSPVVVPVPFSGTCTKDINQSVDSLMVWFKPI